MNMKEKIIVNEIYNLMSGAQAWMIPLILFHVNEVHRLFKELSEETAIEWAGDILESAKSLVYNMRIEK